MEEICSETNMRKNQRQEINRVPISIVPSLFEDSAAENKRFQSEI